MVSDLPKCVDDTFRGTLTLRKFLFKISLSRANSSTCFLSCSWILSNRSLSLKYQSRNNYVIIVSNIPFQGRSIGSWAYPVSVQFQFGILQNFEVFAEQPHALFSDEPSLASVFQFRHLEISIHSTSFEYLQQAGLQHRPVLDIPLKYNLNITQPFCTLIRRLFTLKTIKSGLEETIFFIGSLSREFEIFHLWRQDRIFILFLHHLILEIFYFCPFVITITLKYW